VAKLARPPSVVDEERRALTIPEAHRLIAEAGDDPLEGLVTVALKPRVPGEQAADRLRLPARLGR
jgi:hypothetical protein